MKEWQSEPNCLLPNSLGGKNVRNPPQPSPHKSPTTTNTTLSSEHHPNSPFYFEICKFFIPLEQSWTNTQERETGSQK